MKKTYIKYCWKTYIITKHSSISPKLPTHHCSFGYQLNEHYTKFVIQYIYILYWYAHLHECIILSTMKVLIYLFLQIIILQFCILSTKCICNSLFFQTLYLGMVAYAPSIALETGNYTMFFFPNLFIAFFCESVEVRRV